MMRQVRAAWWPTGRLAVRVLQFVLRERPCGIGLPNCARGAGPPGDGALRRGIRRRAAADPPARPRRFPLRLAALALSREHRVIALDLKSFGQSDKPFDEHYSAADQAALVSAFIRKRGLSGVTLVGHSFGGVVALRTALDFSREPGAIARLVVMDTPALQQDLSDGDWFFSVPGLPYAAMAVTPPEFMTRMMLRLVSAPGRVVPESDVRGYAAPFYDLGSRHAFIATGQSIIDTNGPKMGRAYRSIAQPALIVWCRRDRIVPVATGRRLAHVLPNARLAILNRCNHLPQDEVPKALLSTLLPFLGG